MMNGDTKDFLRHLLFCADNLDGKKRPLKNKTVFNFSVPFVNALEEFLAGFREFIEPHELDLSGLNRTFGGSVYLSLSGHGAGFWDERDSELGDKLHELLLEYSGRPHRFHELDGMLHVERDGVIDLAYLPEFLEEARKKLFGR